MGIDPAWGIGTVCTAFTDIGTRTMRIALGILASLVSRLLLCIARTVIRVRFLIFITVVFPVVR